MVAAHSVMRILHTSEDDNRIPGGSASSVSHQVDGFDSFDRDL